MLRECWDWLRASADREQRRLGYVGEAVAISARHARCRDAWEQHLAASRQFIVQAISHCQQRRKVLVLGAGACLDVPLAELHESFERVVLVDAVQLASTQKKLRQFPRCEFVVHDLTEINSALFAIDNPEVLHRLTSRTPRRFVDEADIDLVISANVLSQLPLLPMRWLQQRQRFDDETVNQFGLDLMRAHCRYLQQFPSHKVLIYDAEQWTQNIAGFRSEHVQLDNWVNNEMALLPLVQKREWQWQLAPLGESGQTSTVHRVQAEMFAP